MDESHQSYFAKEAGKRKTSATGPQHHGTGAKPTNPEFHEERRWSLNGKSMDSSHRSTAWSISPEETPLAQWLKSADNTPTIPIALTQWPYLQTPPADKALSPSADKSLSPSAGMPLSPSNAWNPRADPVGTDIDLRPFTASTTRGSARADERRDGRTTDERTQVYEDMAPDAPNQMKVSSKAPVPTITPPTPLLTDEPTAKAAEVYTFPQPLPSLNTFPQPWAFQPAVHSPFALMHPMCGPLPVSNGNPYQVPQHMFNVHAMNAPMQPFPMATYPMQQAAPQIMLLSPNTVTYVMQQTTQGTFILVPVQTMPMPQKALIPHRPVEIPLRPAPRDVRPSAIEQAREQVLLAEVVKHIGDSNPGGTCGFVHMQSHLREKSLEVVRDGLLRFDNSWHRWVEANPTMSIVQYSAPDITRLELSGWTGEHELRICMASSTTYEIVDKQMAHSHNSCIAEAQQIGVDLVLTRGPVDVDELRDVIGSKIPYLTGISKSALKRLLLKIPESPLWVTGNVVKPRRFGTDDVSTKQKNGESE